MMEAKDFAHEVVVVTGASAGIGRATARLFGRRGARVGLLARGVDGLSGAAREIASDGGIALAVPTDVSDAESVERAAERIEQELGPISVWVNSAMVTVFAPVSDLSSQEVKRVTDVTYLGTVYGTMAALRRMRPRNRGIIVQVGSALAYRSIPLQSAYCGAKSAVRGFTDSLRSELLHDGSDVRVTMVQLSAFNTPQFDWARNKMPHKARPVPPIFQPEVAAVAIVHASHHPRREMVVGFPAQKAILANHFIPGLLDRLLATKGYDGQQSGEPASERPDNLFEPVAGDRGAHGRFDATARTWSAQTFLAMHRRPLLIAAACALAAGAVAVHKSKLLRH